MGAGRPCKCGCMPAAGARLASPRPPAVRNSTAHLSPDRLSDLVRWLHSCVQQRLPASLPACLPACRRRPGLACPPASSCPPTSSTRCPCCLCGRVTMRPHSPRACGSCCDTCKPDTKACACGGAAGGPAAQPQASTPSRAPPTGRHTWTEGHAECGCPSVQCDLNPATAQFATVAAAVAGSSAPGLAPKPAHQIWAGQARVCHTTRVLWYTDILSKTTCP